MTLFPLSPAEIKAGLRVWPALTAGVIATLASFRGLLGIDRLFKLRLIE